MTVTEPWYKPKPGRFHHYDAALEFLKELVPGHRSAMKQSALVIGSPFQEYEYLDDTGRFSISYLDVREPKWTGPEIFIGDATDMEMFEGNQFDLIVSTCVLCHAGMGRYGDKAQDAGDEKMLSEMRRVLKPGGEAVVQTCVADVPCTVEMGAMHRVYSMESFAKIVEGAGFNIERQKVWSPSGGRWLEEYESVNADVRFVDYMSAVLR